MILSDFPYDEIQELILSEPLLYFNGISKLEGTNLEKLVVEIINLSKTYNTISFSPFVQTSKVTRRSIGDIFRILHFYDHKVSLKELYDTIIILLEKDIIYSWICNDIQKRIYGITLDSGLNNCFNSQKIDEYAFDFSKYNLKRNITQYGAGKRKLRLKKTGKFMKIENVTIGADIEVFLQDKETKEIVSAEGYVQGTKHEPFNFDASNPFFAVSLDNVLAEFCIPPATRTTDWLENIKKSLNYINSSIPETLCTVALPAANLDQKYLNTQNAKMFGCDRDFNAWTRAINDPPATGGTLRSGGGHVHIGFNKAGFDRWDIMETELSLVKALDLFLGVPSVIQEPANERKRLYGKAGCFRPKEYGIEYRTLSNYYLSSDALTEWVFNNALAAINFLNEKGPDLLNKYEDMIIDTINYSYTNKATDLINEFQIPCIQ